MDKVNFRQFLCMTFIVTISMKMFMLPVIMMRVAGRDSFVSLCLTMAADFLLLLAVCAVMHLAGEKNLFDLLSSAFGKTFARAALCLVGVFYLFKLFVILADVRIFFSTSVFSSTMSPVHLLPLIVLMGYFAFKPASVTGRISELITPAVFVSMILLSLMTLPEVDFSNVLPLAAEGWERIFLGTYSFALWFGDFAVLLAMTGRVKNGGGKLYFSLIAAAVGAAFMLTFSTALFSAYGDMTEVLTYGHNISNMTQYGAGSYKFGRIDLIIYTLWLSAVLLSAGLMMIFFTRAVSMSFGEKAARWTTVAACAALFVCTMIFSELNRVTEFMSSVFWAPALVVQYLCPLLCLIAAVVCRIRGRRAAKEATA